MSDRKCPKCQRGRLLRSERRGFWERVVLPMFHRYPWRCTFCRERMNLNDRGVKRQYVQADRPVRQGGEQGI